MKYKQPSAHPYPIVGTDVTGAALSASNDTQFNLGDLVQLTATNKVFRLVSFDHAASADIDFADGLVCVMYDGWVEGGSYTIRQDASDGSLQPAGVTQHAHDISAFSADYYGWIQVGGDVEVTNHDGTCALGATLSIHDDAETDVRATLEAAIGIVVAEAGTTTPIIRLTLPWVQDIVSEV
jgi:hypothetical protein